MKEPYRAAKALKSSEKAMEFSNKTAPSAQKMRGGYYTPRALADYLCQWAIRGPCDRVLEPSCGDGSFLVAASSMLGSGGSLTAIEVVSQEIEKAKQSVNGTTAPVDWHCRSFFDLATALLDGERFDVVLGNPPFIRFQHFDRRERDRAFGLVKQFGYRPTGLANAWVAFVQLAAELLHEGGRLAMVVPAELLQVQYAAELRFRLPTLFENVTLVAFDELVFPQIQQEVVLLLADGRRRGEQRPGRLHVRQVTNGHALLTGGTAPTRTVLGPEVQNNGTAMKWTSLFLHEQEDTLLRTCSEDRQLHRLGDLADVDVGIVTGRNSFFVVSEEQAQQLGAGSRALDVVGRTSALKSIRFTDEDMRCYASTYRSKLLNLSGLERERFPSALDAYVKQGEAAGVHTGYKCRIRDRWFDVPSTGVPDAFLFRQIHTAPLLAVNCAGATSTDTVHRVRVHGGVDGDRLAGAMVNSLTFAWSEVAGRSYGGGVLELEPREAETLLLPYQFAGELDLEFLDSRLREGDLPAALAHGDDVLLRRGCGLSKGDIERLRSGWNRLRLRRQRRRREGNRNRHNTRTRQARVPPTQ